MRLGPRTKLGLIVFAIWISMGLCEMSQGPVGMVMAVWTVAIPFSFSVAWICIAVRALSRGDRRYR
jgi:hypothetical protein